MPVITTVGRKNYFKGKNLFEICCNLKNYGVGRVMTRSSWDMFPEPSYVIPTCVHPYMDKVMESGQIWGWNVFRGIKSSEAQLIQFPHITDWRLVPKSQEGKFCAWDYEPEIEWVEPETELPALLKVILAKENRQNGVDGEPKLTLLPFNEDEFSVRRLKMAVGSNKTL